ncbi:MAG TPA: hypothetical protein VFN01_00570 [Marinobacter sp.]|uniref:hypothetical protein n=1 Tax=Marinobacter sp. TaxID=50741 RepID=UPI002D7ED55D|nr:hypothetical protein [Marinobacter sp.]HET8799651.1 hypothetical protein [Marinobacter sp.]
MQQVQFADAKRLAILKEIAPNQFEREKRKLELESFTKQPLGTSMCDNPKQKKTV